MSREWAGVHALGDVCGNQTGPLGRPAFPPEFIIPATATFPPPPPPPGFFLHTKASERKRELFSLQPAHIHTHSSQEGFIVGGRFYFIFLKTPGTWDILSVFSEVGKWHTEREGELHRARHTTGGGGSPWYAAYYYSTSAESYKRAKAYAILSSLNHVEMSCV